MRKIITGHLTVAQCHDAAPDTPGTEGHIEIECSTVSRHGRGHPRSNQTIIYHQIAVPTGLMDSVMPRHWNARVSALVDEEPDLYMYTLISVDEASDDDDDGLTQAQGNPQTAMAPPLHAKRDNVPGQDEVNLNLLIDALLKAHTTNWEAAERALALWPAADYMSHHEIARAIHNEHRHAEEDRILVISDDDGIPLDYHVTQLTADVHLAIMHPGWADHANLRLDIDDVPRAALLIQELQSSRPTQLDAAARLQLIRPHLDTYLDHRNNESGDSEAISHTLWTDGRARECNTRYLQDEIEQALANHTGEEPLQVPLPQLDLRASVVRIFEDLWLATVSPTQIDLIKRVVAVQDTPVSQLLLHRPKQAG